MWLLFWVAEASSVAFPACGALLECVISDSAITFYGTWQCVVSCIKRVRFLFNAGIKVFVHILFHICLECLDAGNEHACSVGCEMPSAMFLCACGTNFKFYYKW